MNYSFDYENDENYFFNDFGNNLGFLPLQEDNRENQIKCQSFFNDPLEINQQEEIIPINDSIIPLKEDNDINFEALNVQIEEDKYVKNLPKVEKPRENSENGSTRSNSGHQGSIKINKTQKFKIENQSQPKNWRFDMVKKHWKSKISDFGTNEINNLIKFSDLPENLKKDIHKPNSLKFTANPKVIDNFNFLGYDLRTVFTIGCETENLQKQNKENIDRIFKYLEEIGYEKISENLKTIKNYFEMKYEELIIKFYNSNEFSDFKSDEKTKFFDTKTVEQEGFSLLTDYGLLRLFKMTNKKRKRD